MTPFDVPDYGDPAAEYRAATAAAAVFDLSGWTVLRLAGRDVVKFLNGFCTNDVKALVDGDGCEAFVTNVKARALGHGLVFRDGPQALTVYAVPHQAERLVPHFEKYVITEDVTVSDATDDTALLFLTGADLAKAAAAVGLGDLPDLPAPGRFASRDVSVESVLATLRRVDLFGRPGLFLECRAAASDDVKGLLAERGLPLAGRSAFEAVRIEALYPLYGRDVTEDHLAPEAARPYAISYAKGCYLGQEPIARIDALGHVNRRLAGLRLVAGATPPAESKVLLGEKEVGAVTSSAVSFADGHPIALAYLKVKAAEPGTEVTVRTPDGDVPATVFGPDARDVPTHETKG